MDTGKLTEEQLQDLIGRATTELSERKKESGPVVKKKGAASKTPSKGMGKGRERSESDERRRHRGNEARKERGHQSRKDKEEKLKNSEVNKEGCDEADRLKSKKRRSQAEMLEHYKEVKKRCLSS